MLKHLWEVHEKVVIMAMSRLDIRYISPEHFALKLPTGSSKSSSVSLYEGQIHVVAKYDNIHEWPSAANVS